MVRGGNEFFVKLHSEKDQAGTMKLHNEWKNFCDQVEKYFAKEQTEDMKKC